MHRNARKDIDLGQPLHLIPSYAAVACRKNERPVAVILWSGGSVTKAQYYPQVATCCSLNTHKRFPSAASVVAAAVRLPSAQ